MSIKKSIFKNLGSIANSLISSATKSVISQKETPKVSKSKFDSVESNLRELASYKEAEIDEYMFMATFDRRTCDRCGNLDGKVFKVSEAKIGKNLPPLHDGCRCTTRAYFGPQTRKNRQKYSRNPQTGKKELVPANMSFNEWKKKQGL